MPHGFPVRAFEVIYATAFAGDDPAKPIKDREGMTVSPNLAALLTDPRIIVACVAERGELIGFSFAMPTGLLEPSRSAEAADTAYIYYTAIRPDGQGRGKVAPLMGRLLREISRRGFRYVERDAMVDNGWADKLQRSYGPAIVAAEDHFRYGGVTATGEPRPQRFMRIDLSLVPGLDRGGVA